MLSPDSLLEYCMDEKWSMTKNVCLRPVLRDRPRKSDMRFITGTKNLLEACRTDEKLHFKTKNKSVAYSVPKIHAEED